MDRAHDDATEATRCPGDRAAGLRFPVQYVIRPLRKELHDYRGYAGTVSSGVIHRGQRVRILPSGRETLIIFDPEEDSEKMLLDVEFGRAVEMAVCPTYDAVATG